MITNDTIIEAIQELREAVGALQWENNTGGCANEDWKVDITDEGTPEIEGANPEIEDGTRFLSALDDFPVTYRTGIRENDYGYRTGEIQDWLAKYESELKQIPIKVNEL